jgi:hypothetical protein
MSGDDESLRCVKVGDPWRVREIAEALEAEGITSRIDTYPPGAGVQPQRGGRGAGGATQMGVYVGPADHARALEIATEHERSRMPEAESDEELWDGNPDACPGCGTALPPASESCAECGLEFPSAIACARCGGVVDPTADACAVCGAPLS